MDKAVDGSVPLLSAKEGLIELTLIAIHWLVEPEGLLLPISLNDFHIL